MSPVTLEQVFHAGTLAGIAVIAVSLTWLAVLAARTYRVTQHRANTELRAPFENFALAVARDEKLASLYHRGLSGFTGLSSSEQVQFFMIATLVFNYWNEVYLHASKGLIPEVYWDRVQRIMKDFIRYPGVREYWGYRRHWFTEEVQALIDRHIREAGDADGPLYPEPAA